MYPDFIKKGWTSALIHNLIRSICRRLRLASIIHIFKEIEDTKPEFSKSSQV